MSLVTRLLGFGLCLVGAFSAGYSQSIHSTADAMKDMVLGIAADKPDYGQAVAAQATSYIQQSITPIWAYYLVIGIAMAIGGLLLVALGDRKPSAGERGPLPSHPSPST